MSIIPEYWNDPKIIHINALNPKSYFIPFSSKENIQNKHREDSERFFLLNGIWSFKYFDTVQDIIEPFYDERNFDSWNKMQVPGMWQNNGYGTCAYVSSPYPIMFRPPYVPQKNPAAIYSYEFNMTLNELKQYHIVFEGVDSCLYLWINGCFVGYSEVSHCEKVFDITRYLVDGNNILCCCVLKRCTGTYFEDQDKIRLNGIFRDVYILERDNEHIFDLFIKTEVVDSIGKISCDIELSNGEKLVDLYLYTDEAEIVDIKNIIINKKGTVAFEIQKPRLWSAEDPYLYYLIIKCGEEYICKKIGIKSVEIENGIFKFNGKHIKLKGVNRHDTHPRKGYAVSYDDIKKDIMLIKECNINTIRTAHYPNDPRFYELCDELGIYVCSEADIETHGCAYNGDFDYISDCDEYKNIYIDRVSRMIEAQKNNTCIVMWSMCNESGWGRNLEACCDYVHQKNPKWIVHCESAFTLHKVDDREYMIKNIDKIDIYSNMYPSLEHIREILNNKDEKRPYFMCEYSHAMGNSCGDMIDYWDYIYKNDRFIGGCVWEWCEHAVELTNKDGIKYMGYGGDFGDEALNLYNFCADGIVSPNKIPRSSYFEIKNVYAPVHVVDNGEYISILNKYDFTSFSKLDFITEIELNGKVIESKKIHLEIEPGEKYNIFIPEIKRNGEGYFNLKVFDGENMIFVWQKSLNLPNNCQYLYQKKAIEVSETGSIIKICGENFEYVFSKIKPLVDKIIYNGVEVCSANEFALYRAPLDNDRLVKDEWHNDGAICREGNLLNCVSDFSEISVHSKNEYIEIIYHAFIGTLGKKPIFEGDILYTIYSDGILNIALKGEIRNTSTWIPRFGFKWNINKKFDNVKYFGLGPYESYIDKKSSCLMGIYKKKASDFFVDYLKPQESGSAYNTKWSMMTDKNENGIGFVGEQFSFNVSEYSLNELLKKKHTYELNKDIYLNVFTDYFMSGVGSGACGPQLSDNYKLKSGAVEFNVMLFPVEKNTDPFVKLSNFYFFNKK